MTTHDHIGADPALGIGAGQTRRGTPVDLAREVLDRYERHLRDDTRHGMTFPMSRGALNLHINAAPALARAVLAVAQLAEDLDYEANTFMDDADLSRAKAAYAHAARIRAALNGDRA